MSDAAAVMPREERSDPRTSDAVSAELYASLRSIAGAAIRSGGAGGRIRPTELAHDCYVRLSASAEYGALRRRELLSLAARVIRNLLVDRARREGLRRATRISGIALAEGGDDDELDLLALDEALVRLARRDERQARIVELKFFAGLSGDEIAALLGVTRRTVTKEWTMARAWLRRELER